MDAIYTNLEQIAQLLKTTFTGGDTEAIKDATETLLKLSENPLPFSEALIKIIKIDNADELTEKIKSSASLALTRAVTESLKKGKISQEQRSYLINNVIECLFSQSVSLSIKFSLQLILIMLYVLEMDSKKVEEGFLFALERLKENNVSLYCPSLLMIQAIINVPLTSQKKIALYFKHLSQILIEIGGTLVNGIISEINEALQIEEKLNRACYVLKILAIWVKLIQEFIKYLNYQDKSKSMSREYLSVLVENEGLAKVLTSSLAITFPTEKQLKDCMISTSGHSSLDSIINSLRANVLKIYNQFLDPRVLIDLNQFIPLERNVFFMNAHNFCIPFVIKAITSFFNSENLSLEQIHNTQELREIIAECISFTLQMVIHPSLQPLFYQCYKSIVMDVCFPLMITNQIELENFVDNPSQFVLTAVDICGSKSSKTLKSLSAKLLYELCMKIDGVLSYTATLVYMMIDYSMVSNSPEIIPENYKELAEHINSIYISKLNATTRVESCLTIIGAICPFILIRKDLLNMLEKILTTYKEFFFGAESAAIIKARLCMIFPYLSIVLFSEEGKQDMFILMLRFLLECAVAEGPDFGALSEQANESLYRLFEKESLTNRLSIYIIDILKSLGEQILTSNVLKLFDTINEIVGSFSFEISKDPEVFLKLFELLVQRCIIEYENTRTNEKPKIFLNKIGNIIRTIGQISNYVKNYQAQIESLLDPMFEYFKTDEKVNFDEDIFIYATSATQITKEISPSIWKLFQLFPKIFNDYGGKLFSLFSFLNYIIFYGWKTINSDPETIKTLVEMGITSLGLQSTSADISTTSDGALFLQLIFQYLRPIPDELIDRILNATYEQLRIAKVGLLRARLGGVFLNAFLHNFEVTQEILHQSGKLSELMDLFLKEILLFEESSYDRKVLLIGLCNMLVQEKLYPEIENRFEEIFDVIISMLSYVQYMEQMASNSKRNKENDDEDLEDEMTVRQRKNYLISFLDIKERFTATLEDRKEQQAQEEEEKDEISDDDPEDYDEDEDESCLFIEKNTANDTVKNFVTELKSKDEYECFREAVLKLKVQNLELIQRMVQILPEKKQIFLKDVLQSRRVITNEEGATQARKIVKTGAKRVAKIQVVDGLFVQKNG